MSGGQVRTSLNPVRFGQVPREPGTNLSEPVQATTISEPSSGPCGVARKRVWAGLDRFWTGSRGDPPKTISGQVQTGLDQVPGEPVRT